MTTTVVFGEAGDGYVNGVYPGYSSAREGPATTVTTTSPFTVGQGLTADYRCFEGFIGFDTSAIADGDTVSAAVLELWLSADNSAQDFTIEARSRDWGGTLEVGDFVAGSGLGALTLVASLATSGIGATGAYKTITESGTALRGAVNKTGFTRMLLDSDRHRLNTAPVFGTAENVAFVGGDAAGTTNDPKLTVTHAVPVTGVAAGAWGAWTGVAAGVRTVLGAAAGAWGAWTGVALGIVIEGPPKASGAWGAWSGVAVGRRTIQQPRTMAAADVLDVRVGQVQVEWVFDVVDVAGEVLGRLTPLQSASIDHSVDRRVFRRLDGLEIPPSEQADVDPSRDRIRPGMVIAGVDRGQPGHTDTPLPWGEYLFDDRPREVASWGDLWHGSLLDTTAMLDDPISSGVTYGTADMIYDALVEHFEAALFTRYRIDLPTDLPFGARFSATVGTQRIDLMRQLAALGGCGLWGANDGIGVVSSIPVGDTNAPLLSYEYGRNILRDSVLLNDARLRAPNRWVVVDTAATTQLVGVADLPASANGSAQKRGRIITAPPRNVQGIPGSTPAEKQANADAMARLDMVRSRRAAETASWNSAVDPRHDTFDYVGLLGVVHVENAWRATLAYDGEMTHDSRVTYA